MRASVRFSLLVGCLGALTAVLAWCLVTPSATLTRAASRPTGGLPQFGADVRVNPTPSPTTRRNRNFTMAVDPTNSDRVLAGYEYGNLSELGSGYAFSTDAGQTWNGNWLLGPWGPQGLTPNGNPSVAADSRGTFYFSTQVASQANNLNGYAVLTSTDGVDWSTPVPVKVTSYSEYRDQGYLAVDHRADGQWPYAGSLYLIWRFFGANFEGAWLTFSRDGGATWNEQVEVSDPDNSYIYGPSLDVASNGWVYAAFSEFDLACICSPAKLFLDRSTDGGQTWGTDRLITGAPITAIGAPDPKGRELTLPGSASGGLFRINHFPSFVLSPTDPNTVYVVWNDGRWDARYDFGSPGKHSDIAFSRTTDGGVTWTKPERVNDDMMGDGIDQWQPKIALRPDGVLGVTWYDRRDDPDNSLYNLYYSQSTDGGDTWSANQKVSDVASNPMAVPDYKGMGDIGFRSSLVFGQGFVLPGWVDTRRGTAQDFYADRGALPFISPTSTHVATATPDSTSTPFPTASASVSASPTPCAPAFSDVSPGDYFYQAVRYLYCEGAISGYSDGTFRPYNSTTRGQLSKIVVLAEGWSIDTTGGPHFSDVPPSNPFYDYVETAFHHGIISGYADGTFRWGNNVTRAQLTKVVVSAQGWAIDTTGGPHFLDVPVGDPFYGFIETAFNHGIITGYDGGTFRPGNDATRGQIAKIVYQAVTGP